MTSDSIADSTFLDLGNIFKTQLHDHPKNKKKSVFCPRTKSLPRRERHPHAGAAKLIRGLQWVENNRNYQNHKYVNYTFIKSNNMLWF